MELVAPMNRQLIGVDTDQTVILFAGRFEEQKNMKNLILAFRRVMQRPKIVAFLCGEGPMLSELEVEIGSIGLVDRIFIPGYVTDIWSWMKSADIFVSVSLFEGMPNTVMEAMACGCPLVVSDIPQHREILDDDSATFVSPDDPTNIASGIDRLLGDPEEARRKALCAKERASRWSIPAMAERYERVYLEILGAAK